MSDRTCTWSVGSLAVRLATTTGEPLEPRSARAVVITLAVVAALVWPGHDTTAEPPSSATTQHRISQWDAPGDGGWRTSPVVSVDDLVLLGASWGADADVQARARTSEGWGPWQEMQRHADHAPDDEHDAAPHDDDDDAPARSEPIWTGRADALQLRSNGSPDVDVTTVTMSGPDGLAYSPRPMTGSTAYASTSDDIVSRSAWDPAGECRPRTEPEFAPDVDVGVVHHTHIFPHYTPEEADDLIRAICLYHVGERGFDDLAYNLLIDRYGTVYEGREGGVERPVVGAHAAGFNESSFGVAVVGDFEDHDVPQPALDALDRVLAWKFSVHGIEPHATHEVISTGGETPGLTGFPTGAAVTLPSIIGHRDTASDSLCPGQHLYARLDGAPERVADLMATGVRMQVAPTQPGTPADPEEGGVVADEPAGPPTGSVGLMAAPAPVADLPDTGGAPASLLGAASLGLAGLAVGGRRRR